MSELRTRAGARVAGGGAAISRRSSWFLVAVGVWSWIIWPTFLKNVWADDRSFDDDRPTAFFLVHAVLTAASLVIGTVVAVIGARALRPSRSRR